MGPPIEWRIENWRIDNGCLPLGFQALPFAAEVAHSALPELHFQSERKNSILPGFSQ
jgi:hypothetical protein